MSETEFYRVQCLSYANTGHGEYFTELMFISDNWNHICPQSGSQQLQRTALNLKIYHYISQYSWSNYVNDKMRYEWYYSDWEQ